MAATEREPPKRKPKKDPALWDENIRDALAARHTLIEKNHVKYGDHLGHLVVTDYQGQERAVPDGGWEAKLPSGTEEEEPEKELKTRHQDFVEAALGTARPSWEQLESQKARAQTTTRTINGKQILCRSTPTMWQQDESLSREAPEWFMQAWDEGD